MPVVIIAEKPSVAADIAKVLGASSKQETQRHGEQVEKSSAVA